MNLFTIRRLTMYDWDHSVSNIAETGFKRVTSIVNKFISKNEDYSPIFSMAEVPLNGIDPLARCCTLAFSVRNVPFLGE